MAYHQWVRYSLILFLQGFFVTWQELNHYFSLPVLISFVRIPSMKNSILYFVKCPCQLCSLAVTCTNLALCLWQFFDQTSHPTWNDITLVCPLGQNVYNKAPAQIGCQINLFCWLATKLPDMIASILMWIKWCFWLSSIHSKFLPCLRFCPDVNLLPVLDVDSSPSYGPSCARLTNYECWIYDVLDLMLSQDLAQMEYLVMPTTRSWVCVSEMDYWLILDIKQLT